MNRWVVAVFGFVLLANAGSVLAQSVDRKAIARRYFEDVLNKGDAAAIEAIVAEDVVFRNPPNVIKGLEGFRKLVAGLRAAFPDLHFTLEDEIAEGDKVATRWVMRGTQDGPIEGRAGTGKKMEVTGMDIFLITGGKVREVWVNMDRMGQAQQLGWLPAQAAR